MENNFNSTPSEMYRLMTYFAHSTLCIYQKTIKCDGKMSINDFRNENELVVKRVFDEALSIFNYELSYEQMNRAITVYFQSSLRPLSVLETDVYHRAVSDGELLGNEAGGKGVSEGFNAAMKKREMEDAEKLKEALKYKLL